MKPAARAARADATGERTPVLLRCQTVKVAARSSMAVCLGEIHRAVTAFVADFDPRHVALEQTIYVQNFQTAQILGAARGAVDAPAESAFVATHREALLSIRAACLADRGRCPEAAATAAKLAELAPKLDILVHSVARAEVADLAGRFGIRTLLAGNLCRCTGYDGIIEGVEAAIRADQAE